jgi:hypothetical protein
MPVSFFLNTQCSPACLFLDMQCFPIYISSIRSVLRSLFSSICTVFQSPFLNMKCSPASPFPNVQRSAVSLFLSTCSSQHLALSHSYILSLAYYHYNLSRSLKNRKDNNSTINTIVIFTPQSARIDRF